MSKDVKRKPATGHPPIILWPEGIDSNANKCHNPVLTVIKYIPSNVTVNGNDKYPVSVDIIHIPQIAAFAIYFQPSKLVIRILMDLARQKMLYQASLADALRV